MLLGHTNALPGVISVVECCRDDLSTAMEALDADPKISALVLTGSEKAFAAGADIKEMAPKSYMVIGLSVA